MKVFWTTCLLWLVLAAVFAFAGATLDMTTTQLWAYMPLWLAVIGGLCFVTLFVYLIGIGLLCLYGLLAALWAGCLFAAGAPVGVLVLWGVAVVFSAVWAGGFAVALREL